MEAAQALVKIIAKRGKDLYATNPPLTRLARSHTMALVFRETSLMGGDFTYNRPLYVEAVVQGNNVSRALVDGGSGINIIPTLMFQAIGLPMDQLRPTTTRLSTFHGEAVNPKGCIIVMLEVGPIQAPTRLQLIDGAPSYHILLGRPWIYLHQCVKSSFRGKDIEIPATKAPFDALEAHLVDAAMFNEFAPSRVNVM